MFHNIIEKACDFIAFIFYIRPFCVVCHTKLHLSVHVLLGQHHLYPLGLIIKLREE